jgi:hypothetical protein
VNLKELLQPYIDAGLINSEIEHTDFERSEENE